MFNELTEVKYFNDTQRGKPQKQLINHETFKKSNFGCFLLHYCLHNQLRSSLF